MSSSLMPSIFLAHGSPILLTDRAWMDELAAWARALPRPKAVLMLSAHWLDKPVTIGATTTVPLVYDFYGFPAEFYKTQYPAPGAPALAERVRQLLGPGNTADEPERGSPAGGGLEDVGHVFRRPQAYLERVEQAAEIVDSGFDVVGVRFEDLRPDVWRTRSKTCRIREPGAR